MKKPRTKPTLPSRPASPAVAADEAVRREWLRRVEAEYRSGAQAQHLTLWLMQLGAPPDLIEMGLRIVSDELRHAELSTQVYLEAQGQGAPNLSRETLALTRTGKDPLELDVLRTCVEMFCLGETVAVRLFGRLREGSSVPVVRQALERIQRDEVFHRDFGWTLLSWLLTTPMEPLFRATLNAELPAMLLRLRRSYGGIALDKYGAEALERMGDTMSQETRAWGLMPIRDYLAVVEESFARDYQPRFSALSISIG